MLRQAKLKPRIAAVLKWEGIIVDPAGPMLALLAYQVSRVLTNEDISFNYLTNYFIGALIAIVLGIVIGLLIGRSEEHTSELQSRGHLVCRLLLEKKNNTQGHEEQAE